MTRVCNCSLAGQNGGCCQDNIARPLPVYPIPIVTEPPAPPRCTEDNHDYVATEPDDSILKVRYIFCRRCGDSRRLR